MTLYKVRHGNTRPALPHTIDDLVLQGSWTKTSGNEDFLLIDDGTGKRILLVSIKNLLIQANTNTCLGFQKYTHLKTIYGYK